MTARKRSSFCLMSVIRPYMSTRISRHQHTRALIARVHVDRVKGCLLDRPQVGIRLDGRVTMRAVKRPAAAAVVQIAAGLAESIEPADSDIEPGAVDAAQARKLLQRACPLQIAAVEPRLRNAAGCCRAPRIELPLPAVHDQPARNRLTRLCLAPAH